MKLENATCLVSGGAGFIGSHLVDRLLQIGARVRVFDDFSNGRRENLVEASKSGLCEIRRGSVLNPLDVEGAMDGMQIVFHLACLGVRHSIARPFDNHRVNAEGSLLMLEAARSKGVARFVHCSSSEVYGSAREAPMTETHPTMPETVYGAGKLAGEAYARAFFRTYGLPVVVIRPFNTFGPRSHHEGEAGEVIPKFIVRALSGNDLPVFGDGGQTRDFTYVGDTAEALVAAAGADALVGRTVNVGSGTETTIGKLAAIIRDIAGSKQCRVVYTQRRPGDVDRLLADATAIRRACGWRPKIDFAEGLERTVSYFQDHPKGVEMLMSEERGRNWEAGGQ